MSDVIDVGSRTGLYGNTFQSSTEAQHQGVVAEPAFNDFKEIQHRHDVISRNPKDGMYFFPYGTALVPSNCGAHPGEFAVSKLEFINGSKTAYSARRSTSNLRDGYPDILTVLNGLYVEKKYEATWKHMSASRRKAVMRKGWRYAGLVKTHIPFDRWGKNGRVEGTIFKAGTTSVFNTGRETIAAGKRFMWNFPDPETDGQFPHRKPYRGKDNDNVNGKVLVAIEPYNVENVLFIEQAEALEDKAAHNPACAAYLASLNLNDLRDEEFSAEKYILLKTEAEEGRLSFSDMMEAVYGAIEDARNRVIGRSLLTVMAGDQTDIQLNKYI